MPALRAWVQGSQEPELRAGQQPRWGLQLGAERWGAEWGAGRGRGGAGRGAGSWEKFKWASGVPGIN